MAQQVPGINEEMFNTFKKYVSTIIAEEIAPRLPLEVKFDPKAWFNHLTSAKQTEVANYFENPDILYMPTKSDYKDAITYTNFVKSEKQLEGDKTRCICNPKAIYKYIAGPVTYELEQWFKKNFKGYCTPLTYGAQEEKLDEFEELGYSCTIQLDGSGFDLTQHYELKEIIDIEIYKLVKHLIPHVDGDLFMRIITPEFRNIIPTTRLDNKERKHGYMSVRGKTFSGSCDTTLMNTIRMAMYCRFAVERCDIYDYHLWVKGDDTVIFCKPEHSDTIKKSINQIFCPKELYDFDSEINYGLGQISKFIKMGTLIDFDFCSTMCIKTEDGFKILRKLTNIINKEHLSVKITQCDPRAYHNELLISAASWLGDKDNILHKYMKLVHPYTPDIAPINKQGKCKIRLPTDGTVCYEDNYIDYRFYILEERQSNRSFTDEELVCSLMNMVDDDQLKAYHTMMALVDLGL